MAWDRRSPQGLCGAKHPGVSGWLSPPLEKLTSDSSQQPWAQRKPGAPTSTHHPSVRARKRTHLQGKR